MAFQRNKIWVSDTFKISSTTDTISTPSTFTATTNPPSTCFQQIDTNNKFGDNNPSTKESYRNCSSSFTGFSFQPLYHTKKGRRSKTSTQLEKSKQSPSTHSFQNGNYDNDIKNDSTTRLSNISRSARCFPSHINSSFITPSTSISLEKHPLSVSSATIWTESITSDFLKSTKTNPEMGKKKGNKNISISRRFNNNSFLSPTINKTHTNGISKINSTGLVDQHEEINNDTFTTIRTPGFSHQHKQHDDFFTRKKDTFHPKNGVSTNESNINIMEPTGTIHRYSTFNSTRQPTSPITNQEPTKYTKLNQTFTELLHISTHEEGSSMVDIPITTLERSNLLEEPSNGTNLHRCISNRLGDSIQPTKDSRKMVINGKEPAHQYKGTPDSYQNILSHEYTFSPSTSTLHGQHISDSIHKETGWYQINSIESDCNINMELLFPTLDSPNNSIRSFNSQSSRCTISPTSTTNRMAVASTHISIPGPNLGTTQCGSICNTSEQQTSTVCNPSLPSSSNVDQCLLDRLDDDTRSIIPCSSMESNTSNSSEINTSPSTSNIDNTKLAISTLVPYGTEPVNYKTNHYNTRTSTKRKQPDPSEEQGLDFTGVERRFKEYRINLFTELISSLQRSKNTSRYYNYYNYINWCVARDLDPLSTTASQLIDYLVYQTISKKWKHTTILKSATAIIKSFDEEKQVSIKSSPIYITYLKDIKSTTILPPKHLNFDIQPALNFIISLGHNNKLNFQQLTQKTAWLISMVGYLRSSDLERVDLNSTVITKNNILHLSIIAPKETRKGCKITKAVSIHPHDDPLLCPVAVFKAYITLIAKDPCIIAHPTVPLTKINAFLRALYDIKKPIKSERITKYINEIMKLAIRPQGSSMPKARALGSTLAALSGVPIDDIMLQGNWSSKQVFEQFYRIKSTASVNLTMNTLNTQPKSVDTKCNLM